MDEEPDFKAFARSWVQGDKRLEGMDADATDALVARLAQAMERRRQKVAPEVDQGGHLIFQVDSSRLDDRTGVDREALDEIARAIAELQPKQE